MDSPDTVDRLRSTFEAGTTRPIGWRLAQLEGVEAMLREHGGRFERALHDDLGKAPAESIVTEIGFLLLEVAHLRKHLRRWLAPRRSAIPAQLLPASAATMLEPLGVALVIAPWNYPLMLALSPLLGALAAGDAAILKPSELTPATSRLLAEMLPRYVDGRAVAVVEGGAEVCTELLGQRFDTIFFTGSERVGRLVLAAAAKHLTPVTLELGGRCPVWVDETADLDVAARRIVWGKFVNAGQTCVAPDHVLATPAVAARLVPRLVKAVRALYGEAPLSNPDYARIVSDEHLETVAAYLGSGDTAVGGGVDRSQRRIEPTVLIRVPDGAPVLQQEIFGPVLPVVEVPDEAAAIARVRSGGKPLAAYVFTADRASRHRWLTTTSSGACCFNIAVAHLAVPGIPFGGVGASGMGSYHGRRSVVAFSHEKAVFAKAVQPDTLRLLSPPYTAKRETLIRRLLG